MAEKITSVKKLSDKNTKQEMLEAYQTLAKQLEAKRQAELNPERQLEEKKTDAALKAAALSPKLRKRTGRLGDACRPGGAWRQWNSGGR